MSKPRYGWWSYAKYMIRQYPKRKSTYDALHDTCITAKIDGIPHAAGISNPTANAALKEMPPVQQREFEAVREAVKTTLKQRNGAERIKVIRLVFWEKTHQLVGAAQAVHFSESVIKDWHGEFIRLVAKNFGLLDENHTSEPKK